MQADGGDRGWQSGLGPEQGGGARPKHVALREALLSAIAAGRWRPGDRLPPETELAAATPYSLGTVQRALRGLVEQGVLVRRRRSGTFVAEPRRTMEDPWHCRFLADDGRGFVPVFPHLLGRSTVRARGPWSAALGEPAAMVRIDRLFDINGEFGVYSRFFVRADRLGELMTIPADAFEGTNLKILIARSFGLPVAQVAQALRVAPLPAAACRAIGIAAGTTGLFMEAVARTAADQTVYYQEFHIPPNARRLYVETVNAPHAAAPPARRTGRAARS